MQFCISYTTNIKNWRDGSKKKLSNKSSSHKTSLHWSQAVTTLRCNTNDMSTNDLVNHMKDIHEVKITNSSHSVTSAAGVWQLEPEVCTGREGPEHIHNNTILFPHSPRNFDRPLEAHRKSMMPIVQHSLVKWRPWHSTTTTQPTSCVGGASPPPHNQQPFDSLSFSQTVPPGSSTSLTDWTGLKDLCQANGWGVGKDQRSCREMHSSRKPGLTWASTN